MAFRHSCPNAGRSGSPKCRPDQPGKGPKKCPGCGAALEVEEGRYGVFQYDPTGRAYRGSDAVAGYQIKSAADRLAENLTEEAPQGGYVVRFIRDRLLPYGS